MREIKFRGKNKKREWLYGDLIHNRDKVYIAPIEIANIFASSEDFEVDVNTIGQFTGLYDNNGKEVYEGDVVKPNPKYITSNCIVVLDGIELKLKTKYWCNFFAKYVWNGCEIVGNIFDNPKLI